MRQGTFVHFPAHLGARARQRSTPARPACAAVPIERLQGRADATSRPKPQKSTRHRLQKLDVTDLAGTLRDFGLPQLCCEEDRRQAESLLPFSDGILILSSWVIKGPREGKAEKTNHGDRAAGQTEQGGKDQKGPKGPREARPRGNHKDPRAAKVGVGGGAPYCLWTKKRNIISATNQVATRANKAPPRTKPQHKQEKKTCNCSYRDRYMHTWIDR